MRAENKNIPLILILKNVNEYIKTINHLREVLFEIQNKPLHYDKKLKVFSELENYFLKGNSFEKTINDLDEFVNFYKDKFEYLLLLKFELKKKIDTCFTFNDYPYLYELSNDWQEIIELQRLPYDRIDRLNHYLKVDYKFRDNQTEINLSDYKPYITETTLSVILAHLLYYIIQRVIIDLFLIKYELEDTLYQFEHNILYGRPNNKNRNPNESSKSFNYKFWNDRNKGAIAMENAYEKLITKNFISKSNTYRDFSNLFRGKTITKRIIWCGLKSDLSHFIKLLHSTHEVIKKRPKDLYKITGKLFISSEGFEFDTEKFKDDKPTKSAKILNDIVKELKGNEKSNSAFKNN